jgi:hypothetical protein
METITTYFIIFLRALWRFAQYMDTVVHEVGHALVTMPLGSKLKIVINPNASGETTGSFGVLSGTLSNPPVRVLHALAGQAASVVFGVVLIASAVTEKFEFSGWWAWTLIIFTVASVLFTIATVLHSFPSLMLPPTFLLLFGYISAALALFGVPSPNGLLNFTGIEFAAALFFVIGGLVLIASITSWSWFTGLVTIMWFAFTFAVFSQPWVDLHVLLILVGAGFIITGIYQLWDCANKTWNEADEENDFVILAAEIGGEPFGWFIFFIVVFAVALVLLILGLFF